MHKLDSVQIALRTNEVFDEELSMSSQIFGSTPWSRSASLNLLLSPEMFPRHQIVYSFTSMWVGESIIDIKMGIAWFSINLSTKLLSLEAMFVKHQIASNCSLGHSMF